MIYLSRGYKVTKTYVIAEAGVNHNGDIDMALELIEKAAEAGADAIKFQTYKAENLVTKHSKKAEYQLKTTGGKDTQLQMLKDLELKYETHFQLKDYCQKTNIDFLSTAFDLDSLRFLSKDLKMKTLKIPSGEITNLPFLIDFAQTGAEIIMSSGMANIDEIRDALGALAFGFIYTKKNMPLPSRKQFIKVFNSNEGQEVLNKHVTLMHCVTEYPAPIDEINLNVISSLKKIFNLRIGYSDHTEGIIASVIAVSHGATIIEKHFTQSKNLLGPDHKASLEPEEFKIMVDQIRMAEKMMGDGEKKVMPSELKNISIARKSIVASMRITKGDIFSSENLSIKRPGNGKSPIHYWSLLGKKATKDYDVDELIT